MDDQLQKGAFLYSDSSIYMTQCFLGEGSFGKVAKCLRIADMKTVAIKIMKNWESSMLNAKKEVSTLLKLKALDPDKCNIVRWYQFFVDREHICLEFEHLDQSLYDFMEERHFQPLLLKEIRPIVQQLACAFTHLNGLGIIHADLKLDNVMLVNHAERPYSVKLIDFGLARDVSTMKLGSTIQALPYRAPEVMLALRLTEAVDMWSLGCMAAEMYLGDVLYPGENEYDTMRYIVETQAMPPDNVLNSGCLTTHFFERTHVNSSTRVWAFRSPDDFYTDSGMQPVEHRTRRFSSLDDLLGFQAQPVKSDTSEDTTVCVPDDQMFRDMIKGMLQLDATKRMTPHQVLEHPFIDMCHLIALIPVSSHVRSCFKVMDKVQATLPRDSGTDAHSNQQKSISTNTSQNKRKAEEEVSAEALQPFKRYKPIPNRYSHLDRTTSGVKRKTADDEDEDERQQTDTGCRKRSRKRSPSPSKSWWVRYSPGLASPGATKRMADDDDEEDEDERQPTDSGYRKRSRKSSPSPSKSRWDRNSPGLVSPRAKKRMADDDDDEDEDERQPRDSGYRKRSRKSSPSPSKSRWDRNSPGLASPRAKKRMADDEDEDEDEKPARETKRIKNSSLRK